jgi:hypothetical protein
MIEEMRSIALRALRRMYLPAQKVFAFHIRRTPQGDVLEGISRRYTAIALIGLADEPPQTTREALVGADPLEVCGKLIEDAKAATDLGEVALTLWAARKLGHPNTGAALDKLQAMQPDQAACPTVELAWSLTALALGGGEPTDCDLSGHIAARLLASFQRGSLLFPHYSAGTCPSRWRAHIGCYADLVYPIQALSAWSLAANDHRALDIANQCAGKMCELQGTAGQWYWHYDVRTGQVLEKYPVYAIHQDAMGPMCLFALAEAGGTFHRDAIAKSVGWLVNPPELKSSLIDPVANMIWRKVARHEPNKLVRSLQAGLSRIHPRLRLFGVDLAFPPGKVDWESRPYHMGWLLHAFSRDRLSRFLAE